MAGDGSHTLQQHAELSASLFCALGRTSIVQKSYCVQMDDLCTMLLRSS